MNGHEKMSKIMDDLESLNPREPADDEILW
jgi:hypothetical protein